MPIDTVEARSRLKARRSPYWTKLATGRHLGFRKMTAGSDGTWLAQAYSEESGKQTRRSLGSFNDLPLSKRFDAASAAARLWFEHLDLGGSSKVITVGDACRSYVNQLRDDRPKTASDTEARYKRWVYPDKIATIALPKLMERHIKEWRNNLAKAPVISKGGSDTAKSRTRTASSLNRDMTALRAALNHARRDHSVTSDLAWRYALAPTKAADGRRSVYIDRKQRLSLIEQSPQGLALFLRGLSMVPLRPGALAALTVADFDRRIGVLTVGKDKTGGQRKIKLPSVTAEFFTARSEGKPPSASLFTRDDGKPWDKDAWKKPLKLAAKAAKLSHDVTAYTLRHSTITDLVTGGLDLLTVAQLSGTSVVMIERHYGHLRADHAAAALANLAL